MTAPDFRSMGDPLNDRLPPRQRYTDLAQAASAGPGDERAALYELEHLRSELASARRIIADRDAWVNYLSRRGVSLGYVVVIPDDPNPLSWDGELHTEIIHAEMSLAECRVEWPSAVVAAVVGDAAVTCDTCGDSGRCTYPSIEAQTIVVVACPDCGSTSNE